MLGNILTILCATDQKVCYTCSYLRSLFIFFDFEFQLTTSCPPPSSCGTDAPGWLPDGHPKPEDGIVNRKVCFHYNGDCCYKALYIDIINCPGMFVYGLVNTVFDFSARYCFDDDTSCKSSLLCFEVMSTLTFSLQIIHFIDDYFFQL